MMSCTNCIGSDRSRSMIGQHPSTHVCTPQLILVHASKCGNPIGENDGSNTVDARFSGTFFSKSWRSSHTFGRFFPWLWCTSPDPRDMYVFFIWNRFKRRRLIFCFQRDGVPSWPSSQRPGRVTSFLFQVSWRLELLKMFF